MNGWWFEANTLMHSCEKIYKNKESAGFVKNAIGAYSAPSMPCGSQLYCDSSAFGMWKDLVKRWNTPILRGLIADSIFCLLTMIWEDSFIDIYKLHQFPSSYETASLNCRDTMRVSDSRVASVLSVLSEGPWSKSVFEKHLTYVISSTKVSSSALVLALHFVHRLRLRQRGARGGPGSEYRLYFVGLMLANKYTEDHPYTNKAWATIIGISSTEINIMEREFLSALKYNLYIAEEEFQLWTLNLSRLFRWSYVSTGITFPFATTQSGIVLRPQSPLHIPIAQERKDSFNNRKTVSIKHV